MGAETALVGAIFGDSASENASEAQTRSADAAANAQMYAADKAAEVQREALAQQKELLAPWTEAGKSALGTLQDKLTAGPGEFTQDPGYLFRLSEGEKAIGRYSSAAGKFLSPSTGKAFLKYGQDYASNEYDKFLARFYQSLAPYQSLAGIGQTSAGQLSNLTGANANSISGLIQGSGEAQANSYLAAGNAQASNYLTQANLFNNVLNQNSGWNAYLSQPYMKGNNSSNSGYLSYGGYGGGSGYMAEAAPYTNAEYFY